MNYHIHTDAIKENLIPAEITKQQSSFVYANEADLLVRKTRPRYKASYMQVYFLPYAKSIEEQIF